MKIQGSPSRSNRDDGAPSGSSTSKPEGHREGPKIPKQPLPTAPPSGNEGNVKKKKGSKRSTKVNLDPVRPEATSPAVEVRPFLPTRWKVVKNQSIGPPRTFSNWTDSDRTARSRTSEHDSLPN